MQLNLNCCLNNFAFLLFLLAYIPTCIQLVVYFKLNSPFFIFYFWSLWRKAKSSDTFCSKV